VCRVIVFLVALCQVWTTRYVVDPDGTAYVDVARAWLRGDWLHALNPYWSPLYVWLLTIAFGLFHPSLHWQLPLMHAVNLLGFVAAWGAWEWLTQEWERWQGPPAHPLLSDTVSYCVLAWAGLVLAELGRFNNADIFVVALLLAVGALLVRVRRGVTGNRKFALLGIALGLGFLAKTAVVVVLPMFLVTLALLLGSWRDLRLWLTALTALAVMVPFVAAISIAQGRFTLGDSGRLNYSWHVTGMSVEGYKENQYWPGPEIQHPLRVLLDHPRVLSYEQHLIGTLPVHAEPSWWCAGYPVRFNQDRQLMILWSNLKFSINAFRCPALLLVLLALPFGARLLWRRFAQAWFLWLPALLFAASYCPVYSDYRYLAASYALIGFALLAASAPVRLPALWSRLAILALPLVTAGLLMGSGFRHLLPQFARDVLGRRAPWEYFNVAVAEHMRQAGLQSGDRVAYIGFSLGAAHVGLERAQIVATVPERISHDDLTWGRPLVFTFPKPDEFWRSSSQDQRRVLETFRRVGAKWVFADCVPTWADTSGWQVAGESHSFYPYERPYLYYLKLE
jgi:4-amino-4-deoxy-L-arabinose transferase-like glycosyltransferase